MASTTKPNVALVPVAMSPAHDGLVTVMCCPAAVIVPFHRELMCSPAGRSKETVQPCTVWPVPLAIVYCPWKPVPQSVLLAKAAVTVPLLLPAAPAVNAATAPAPTAAAVANEIPMTRARFDSPMIVRCLLAVVARRGGTASQPQGSSGVEGG